MDCKVCLDKFNEENKRPRYIPCGHTFCSFCLETLLRNGSLSCPSCRAAHNATDIDQFPIAYLVEELLKQCSAKTGEERSLSVSTSEADANCDRKNTISKKLNALKEEERASLRNVDFTFREILAEMARYKADLAKWDQEHEQLQDEINKLILEPNEEVRRMLSEELTALEDMYSKGEGQQALLRTAAKGLAATETAQEVVTAIDDADHRLVDAEDWIQNSRKRFPNIAVVYKSIKLRIMIRNALDVMSEDTSNSNFLPLHLASMNSSLLQKVHLIGELAPLKLTLESLQRPEGPVRSLVEAGVVFAMKREDDQSRFARISIRHNRVFLHHLNDIAPPPNSYIVQYGDIRDATSNSNTLAFLELSWPAATQRQRVHIRLFPDTARGRQFLIICTGELGPSFANTKFQKVINKGVPGELLMGGSYSCVKGTTLMPTGDRYKRKAVAGVVCGIPHGDQGWDARNYGVFHVATRDNPGFLYNTAFGHVEKGLEVLAAAATLSDVSRVEIVDSGIVF